MLALLVLLFFFFNTQRLHFGQNPSPVDLQNFVYLIGFIVVVVNILVPAARRVPLPLSLLFWAGIYFLCKLVIFRQDVRPFLGDFHTYTSIAEVSLIGLTSIFSRNLAYDLHDFEATVENITLADAGGRLREFEEEDKEMHREIMRSRRYQRALSVIIVQPDPLSLRANLQRWIQQVQQKLIRRYVITSLGQANSRTLRRTDILTEQTDRERFIILCPELDDVAAQELIARIQSIAMSRLGVQVMCGIGSFPNGPTLNELLHQAEASLRRQDRLTCPPVMEESESKR
jgi:hypothetical protein